MRKSFFLIPALMTILGGGILATVQAAPSHTPSQKQYRIDYIYYNNAHHSYVVGKRVRTCDGKWLSKGKQTQYVSVQRTLCH